MTFKLACGDVMPGCAARFENSNRNQLMEQVGAHAASAHGITEVTPAVRQAIESAVTFAA